MSSVDAERERKDTSDLLMTWASKNKGVHAAYDDGEVECTGSGGGKGTTGAPSASVVVEDDGESNASLGDGM